MEITDIENSRDEYTEIYTINNMKG